MNTLKTIDPRRLYLLTRNLILLKRSSIAIVSAAMAGVLLFISLIDAMGDCHQRMHQNLYLIVLFFGGILMTSRSFKALHDPVRGLFWLLLPASMFEKILTQILSTTIVYVAGSMLLYFIFSMVSEGLNTLLFNCRHLLFNPFDTVVLKGALTYMAIQAPFLVGAAYFRKHALSKTVLSLLGLSSLLGLAVLAAVLIIFGTFGNGFDVDAFSGEMDYGTAWAYLEPVARTAAGMARAILWVVLPGVCWTICYFRLKETER